MSRARNEFASTPLGHVMFPPEDSPRGLGRTLGKRVGGNPSRVRISYPPPVPHRARCRRAPPLAVGPFDVVRLGFPAGFSVGCGARAPLPAPGRGPVRRPHGRGGGPAGRADAGPPPPTETGDGAPGLVSSRRVRAFRPGVERHIRTGDRRGPRTAPPPGIRGHRPLCGAPGRVALRQLLLVALVLVGVVDQLAVGVIALDPRGHGDLLVQHARGDEPAVVQGGLAGGAAVGDGHSGH